ncbi:Conserved_hypothetical protein [Hexamita inflata]|uniref:Uncharacterized protein n=1 Tax=Hexamita inflata TaxID=28002 RepID=A0AA86NHH0_9EUKA|nr:Conserved hypothetical protein [Hexamita inflata]
MFVVVLAEAWPKNVNTFSFDHANAQSFTDAYANVLTQHKDAVTKFVADIKATHKGLVLTNAACSDACKQFVKITQLSAGEFNLYNAYIETVLDSMLAFHNEKKDNTMLGYSLTVNANYPGATKVYNFFQAVHVEYNSTNAANKYSALSVAGYEGFFVIRSNTAKQALGFTVDYGTVEELPVYDEAAFVAAVNLIKNTIGSQLLAFTNQVGNGNILNFVQAQVYEAKYLLAFVDYSTKQADFFQSKKGEYQRKDEKSVNQVQSSCRANLENINASDFRIVQMERALNKLKAGCNLDSFYSQLRSFPFRTTYSAIMNAYAAEAEIDFQQKCQSIVDGKEVVNCADPPVPNNWWAIVLSCLLIVVTITVWVFGCIYAKRYEGYEQTAAI